MRLPWKRRKTKRVIIDIGGEKVEATLVWQPRKKAWVNKHPILFAETGRSVHGFALEVREEKD